MCLLFADPGQPLRLGRAAVLHDDGLDDVELDGLRPRPRDHPRPLRRLAPAAAPGKSTLELSGLVCYIIVFVLIRAPPKRPKTVVLAKMQKYTI